MMMEGTYDKPMPKGMVWNMVYDRGVSTGTARSKVTSSFETRISLTVSVAWISPMVPGRIPNTPPSAQLGTRPGGGGSGYRQR